LAFLNFSFCLFAAILTLPIYLVTTPTRSRICNYFQLIPVLLVSPLGVLGALYFLLDTFSASFSASSSHWVALCGHIYADYVEFGTLAYPFLFLALQNVNSVFVNLMLTSHYSKEVEEEAEREEEEENEAATTSE
jgi:hypothetical protein